jgi:lipoate-protein ligase A
MALDHALARCLGAGEGVLRLYGWERPTVSFGRNEPARATYSAALAERLGVDCVRRPTGGRAVLHDGELTYAVVVPVRAFGGVRRAYGLINEALAQALRSLGAEVALAEGTVTLGVDAGPCFQAPAAGEVVGAGRKLVGSAQARVEGALLQHGSIILSGDQSLLDALAGGTAAHEPPATLGELVGDVSKDDVADAVVAGMRGVLGGDWTAAGGHDEWVRAEAARLEAERYGRNEWTWRR